MKPTLTPEEILEKYILQKGSIKSHYVVFNEPTLSKITQAMEEYKNLYLQEVIKELIEESTIAFQKNEIRGNGNYLTILEILKERIK